MSSVFGQTGPEHRIWRDALTPIFEPPVTGGSTAVVSESVFQGLSSGLIPGTIEAMTVTLATAIGAIKAETIVAPHDPEIILSGAFAADLMSDVLAFAREGSLLITGLNTDQTIRTAAIKHLIAVVLIQGKEISPDMQEAAREEGIALYQTPLSKYETCGILVEAGLRPYRSQADLGRGR